MIITQTLFCCSGMKLEIGNKRTGKFTITWKLNTCKQQYKEKSQGKLENETMKTFQNLWDVAKHAG